MTRLSIPKRGTSNKKKSKFHSRPLNFIIYHKLVTQF
jgi:hypothetical protein